MYFTHVHNNTTTSTQKSSNIFFLCTSGAKLPYSIFAILEFHRSRATCTRAKQIKVQKQFKNAGMLKCVFIHFQNAPGLCDLRLRERQMITRRKKITSIFLESLARATLNTYPPTSNASVTFQENDPATVDEYELSQN